ncbi:c-type cytochrome [Amaricoccus sp. W119]|uniref:c-type cytochrome n=1 Tax=Amaricoccus sp. W119 TaxID=3391833 RepID=UPI0039A492C8
MRKAILAAGLTLALGVPALAQDNEAFVEARGAQMSANGAAAGAAGGMLKGEIPYNAAVAKAALATLDATARTFGLMFPEGATSDEAAPDIWSDRAGFDAEIVKFQEASAAAVEASGKDGPADLDAFKAAAQPVLGTCKSCHEKYRLDD